MDFARMGGMPPLIGQRLRQLLGYLVSGVLVLLPPFVCLWVASIVVRWLATTLGPGSEIARNITSHVNMGIADWLLLAGLYLLVLVAIVVLGYWTSRKARNVFTETFRVVFGKFPVLDRIYSAVEQVVNVIRQQPIASGQGGLAKFGDVAFVRFGNLRFMGLLTSRNAYRLGGQEYVQVFMPSSPMPATGFLFMAPVQDVDLGDLSIEDFTKVVVSLGSLTSQIIGEDIKTRGVMLGNGNEILRASPDPHGDER